LGRGEDRRGDGKTKRWRAQLGVKTVLHIRRAFGKKEKNVTDRRRGQQKTQDTTSGPEPKRQP